MATNLPERRGSFEKADASRKHSVQSNNGTDTDRTTIVLPRKKLPWLEGDAHQPPKSLRMAPPDPPALPTNDSTSASRPTAAPDAYPIGDWILHMPGSLPTTEPRSQRTPDLRTVPSQPSSRLIRRKSVGLGDAHTLAPHGESPVLTSGLAPKTDATAATKAPLQGPMLYGQPPQVSERSTPFKLISDLLQTELDLPFDEDVSPRATPPGVNDCRASDSVSNVKLTAHDNGKELYDASRESPKQPTPAAREIASSCRMTEPLGQTRNTSQLPTLPTHLLSTSSSSSQATSAGEFQRSAGHGGRPIAANNSSSLNQAVTVHENLIGEALNLAESASKSGQREEVIHVLDKANLALRDASSVQDGMRQPLGRSTQGSSYSDDESLSDDSAGVRVKPSADTLPTTYSKSTKSSMLPMRSVNNARKSKQSHSGHSSSADESIPHSSPRLNQPPSANSMVRDFAYPKLGKRKTSTQSAPLERQFGEAANYYGDQGQSVASQPGVRKSVAAINKPLPPLPSQINDESVSDGLKRRHNRRVGRKRHRRASQTSSESLQPRTSGRDKRHARHQPKQTRSDGLREVDPAPINAVPERTTTFPTALPDAGHDSYHKHFFHSNHHHLHSPAPPSKFNDKVFYTTKTVGEAAPGDKLDNRYDEHAPTLISEHPVSKLQRYSGSPNAISTENQSLKNPRRNHISLNEDQGFSLGRSHRRQPIARE
jgi:hypothetical protein